MEYLPTFTLTLHHSCMGKYSNPMEHMCMTKLSTSQLRPLAAEISIFFWAENPGCLSEQATDTSPQQNLRRFSRKKNVPRLRLPATQSARRFSLHASATTSQDIYKSYIVCINWSFLLKKWCSPVERNPMLKFPMENFMSWGLAFWAGMKLMTLPAFGRRGFFG